MKNQNITLSKLLKIKGKIEKYHNFIHVFIGPRQVGKTTASRQLCELLKLPSVKQMTADGAILRPNNWLKIVWYEALYEECDLLIVDEIQKIENWSETVKELWELQQGEKNKMKVILLGSSSLEIHKGLSESLAGRFILHPFYHWDFFETNQLVSMSLDDYLRFGGYPGSYQLLDAIHDWLDYIKYSIIDPVIGKDILSLVHVKSPALFRQCFDIVCSYACQEISYTKLLGQLQDRGNTDLIKHYIELFEAAYLIKSLQKYSAKDVLKRNSSPKILPLAPALYSVVQDGQYNHDNMGRAFEIMIGAYLNTLPGKLYYWREKNYEVDFVYEFGKELHAIEVKYGKDKSQKGLEKFLDKFPSARPHLVTPDNYQDFFKRWG